MADDPKFKNPDPFISQQKQQGFFSLFGERNRLREVIVGGGMDLSGRGQG